MRQLHVLENDLAKDDVLLGVGGACGLHALLALYPRYQHSFLGNRREHMDKVCALVNDAYDTSFTLFFIQNSGVIIADHF